MKVSVPKLDKQEILAVVALIVMSATLVVTSLQARHVPSQAGNYDTQGQIARARSALARKPDDMKLTVNLASLYLQQIRETADTGVYDTIDRLLGQLSKDDAAAPDVVMIRAQILLGQHHFAEAVSLIEPIIADNPTNPRYLAILGDAQLEVGEYAAALDSYQRMVDARPDFASYSRIAYPRELYGDAEGALEAMTWAIEAGSSFVENIAWAETERARLAASLGNTKTAQEYLTNALQQINNYSPALRLRGRLAFAEGKYADASQDFLAAKTALPIDANVLDVADDMYLHGQIGEASTLYAAIRALFEKSSQDGVDTTCEEAQFLADHDLDIDRAVQLAETCVHDRPSVTAHDTYAWALYKHGDFDAAKEHSDQALKLDSRDGAKLLHAGLIARARGDTKKAKEYLLRVPSTNLAVSLRDIFTAKTIVSDL